MATRVSNRFKVTAIHTTTSGNKRVTLTPVYRGDPEYSTGVEVYDNTERAIEVFIPKSNSLFNTIAISQFYYMDLTAA